MGSRKFADEISPEHENPNLDSAIPSLFTKANAALWLGAGGMAACLLPSMGTVGLVQKPFGARQEIGEE